MSVEKPTHKDELSVDKLDIEELRNKFLKDKFATDAAKAFVESVEGDCAVCSLKIEDIHKNAAGTIMGGALFTLADFAFAVATNKDNAHVVTVSTTIDFVSAASSGKVFATATPEKIGRSLCFYTVRITDENGNLIAKASIVGKKV